MAVISLIQSFLCLITLLIMLPNSTSKPYLLRSICSNKTMFSNNTQYQTNLNTLLRSLASNAATNPTEFYYTSVGNLTKDAVHGLFLCRGDQNTTSCSDCVATAATNLPDRDCPNMKVATTWYDECTVRYSNASFYREMDPTPEFRLYYPYNVTGNITLFAQVVGNMMDDLAVRAANGGSSKKYATEIVNYTSSHTLYGMVQCTPDLSSSQCDQCLRIAFGLLPISFGGRVMQASCFSRYEIYPFFNGALPPSTPSSNNSTGTAPPLTPPTSGNARKIKIIVVVLLLFFISVAMLVFGLYKRKMRKKQRQEEGYETHDKIECVDSMQFDFDTIQFATDNFSDVNRLSTGSSTTTYKGVLSDGHEIAVKRMDKVGRDGKLEFDNEVLISANLQHKNLVKLLGLCIEKDQRFLVYEFLPNGSLQGFLHDSVKRANFDWQTRYEIIQGVARGLCYLHEDSQLRVIHRDLNPSNILLGVQMDSKISNFRKAILVHSNQTRGSVHEVVGTYGYMAPEYVQHGDASVKSDVFSYGVILLEIITGQAISDFSDRENEECLLTYAWRKWCKGTTLEMVDEALGNAKSDENQIKRCIKIALLCVEEDPSHRPSMSTVVLMLNSNTVHIAEPIRPATLIVSSTDHRETSSYEAFVSELNSL